jgi:uncharacterized protein
MNYKNRIYKFKDISITDRDFFYPTDGVVRALSENNNAIHVSCEYNFANLYMWGGVYNTQWCEFDNTSLILIGKEDVLLFPLLEKHSLDDIIELSKSFIESGGSGNITQVPKVCIDTNKNDLNIIENSTTGKGDFIEICEDRNFADYIHLSERLALLKGKKLRKKRNLIVQFIKEYGEYEDLPLSDEYFDRCLELVCSKMVEGDIEHKEELVAIKRGFAEFATLELDGIVIVLDGVVIAFAIFSPHINDTYLVHFEKSDFNFKGVSQIINQKSAEYLKDKCKYINREQDLGIEGLRKAKLSYDPDCILINYDLKSDLS